ncbi:MAG TPA: iron-containing alcohol dehydrogenase [Caulobacteraceae bacterium]|jgi:alcohol dehydrogenase class IV
MTFAFETTPKIVCEDGAAGRLGPVLAELGAQHVLVVTDPFLAGSGLLQPALASLAGSGVAATVFCDVEVDPPQASVEAAARAARGAGVDAVIGFGGGSSMDTAKLVALLVGREHRLDDIYGVGLAQGPRLPLVQIPTTAGTGSEVTSVAVVTTPTGEKKGVSSPLLHADVAVLDATLTLGLPPRLTAMTGVDAIVHAVEAYTSRHRKNVVSDALAVKAFGLLTGAIGRAVENGSDLEARRAMLQGSLLAGIAFDNAPVAAVHALAYPLGGLFHVPHGLSNALVFAEVAAFNLPKAHGHYAELAGFAPRALTRDRTTGEGFVAAIEALVRSMPMEQRLGEVGVTSGDLDALTRDAMNVTRLLVNNPREVTPADARAIYEAVL